MSLPTLSDAFSNFANFWEEFKNRLVNNDYPERSLFLAKNIFEYYRSCPFWEDEENGINSFMSELAFLCVEVKQRDVIHDQIYSQIKDFSIIRTETRRMVRTNESKGRKVTSFNEPLAESIDMSQNSFGSHGRSDWIKSTQLSEPAPEVTINEGVVTIDENGNKVISPNWTETDDPAALARLINSFPNVEISFKRFLPRFSKIFMQYFSPKHKKAEKKRKGDDSQILLEEETKTKKQQTPIVPAGDIDDDISEKEYKKLKEQNPNSVAENWQLERLSLRKKYISKQISRNSGSLRDKWMLRFTQCEELINAFKRVVEMPPVGDSSEKLSVTADQEEWEKSSFWARINRVVGFKEFKQIFADFVDGYNELVEEEIRRPPQMYLLLGPPGVGKSFISLMSAEAAERPHELISMNGKKDPSLFFGVPQEYGGAGIGEILKAIIRHKDRAVVIIFDEFEKCDKMVQKVLGNITDKETNKNFKDLFFDYPIPINELIIFCTANYPEDIEPFIRDRLTPINITPPTYKERREIIEDFLSYEFKRYKISHLKNNIDDDFKKRFITWSWGVRGIQDNIEKFSYKVFLLNKRNQLPDDWNDYEWPIISKVDLDAGDPSRNRQPCPVFADRKAEHIKGCECFRPEQVEGWVEEMGDEYPE